jgi:hypothetical protein
MTVIVDEAERSRRTEFVREARAAAYQGINPEARTQKREEKADAWSQWFRQKMDHNDCADPVELLPDAFARLEQLSEDYTLAATPPRPDRALARRCRAPREGIHLARQRHEREERRVAEASKSAQLRAEFEAWRAQQAERERIVLEAIGEEIAKTSNEIIDRFEEHTKRMRNAMMDAIETRFAGP